MLRFCECVFISIFYLLNDILVFYNWETQTATSNPTPNYQVRHVELRVMMVNDVGLRKMMVNDAVLRVMVVNLKLI